MDTLAPVNKIIPFSLVDGPGSRCSVFLQGCNIACAYCHNPETQNLCIHCGICVPSCPVQALSLKDGRVAWDALTCINCDTCIKVCPHNASPKIWLATAQEVFERASSYQPFIRGVSVSGGECMLYPRWIEELFSLCHKSGLTTLIDSNGTIDFENYPTLLEVSDGVMLDVKAWDPSIAKKLTSQSPALTATVKANLKLLAYADKLEEVRIVVVDGYNDPEDILTGIAETLGELTRGMQLKLIRFRPFGVKGELVDKSSPTDERMQELQELARLQGFEHIRIT